MKIDDLAWGSDLTPPPHRMCWPKQNGGLGVLGGTPKTKYAQNNYLGKVKKFQNNRLSHFLMGLYAFGFVCGFLA